MTRLENLPTLKINSEKALTLHYGGKTYNGVQGDTIATALYANDVRIFGRSLKYHRPRGLYSLDGECSNTLMEVDGIPNVLTENTPAKNGMQIKAQNVLGIDANYDLMGFMDKLSFMMPAGFYYKTMHRPAAVWPMAIKFIRRAAGLGKLSPDFQINGRYDEIYPDTDVCVIGGGPAGMSAAIAAAEFGLRVILVENKPWLGGFFEYRTVKDKNGNPVCMRAASLAEKIEKTSNIRIFKPAAVTGVYNNNHVVGFQRGGEKDFFDRRYFQIRAKSIVTATGCYERPLLFDNNDRPGVMQIGCAHRLARTYGILPGRNAVFSIGHDLGIETAIDLFDLGVTISCVADTRDDGQDPELEKELAKRDIHLLKGWAAVKAVGWKTLKKVVIKPITGSGEHRLECDLLVASAGLTPETGPLTLGHAKLKYDNHTGFFLADRIPEKMHVAGRLIGLNDPLSIEASGNLAGLRAAADCGENDKDGVRQAEKNLASHSGPGRGSKFISFPGTGKKTFVCFDEDATLKNIDQAMEMGFNVPELIKRFTSTGTGPGQGRIPGHNLALYVAHTDESPDKKPKPTKTRPPLVSPLLATYAGGAHDMSKRTPVHEMQKAAGAKMDRVGVKTTAYDSQMAAGGKMERIGVWNRARYFSNDKTSRDEIENVRNNVGMLDASTLGKFRIHGPDALKALQRVYVSDLSKIPEGKIKYSAMCNHDGCIIDDGIIIKKEENDYYFTTSTARAGATVEWIRYHTRYEGWDFHLVNLTDAFGVINLAGPNARKVLEKVTDADVSNEMFPFTGYREYFIQNIPIRAMRLGFVGELSYEFHVPSSYMQSLWEMIEDAGKEYNIMNFGLEAQNTLRMEKGHLIIGSESEQRTTLHDLGLGFLWDRKKTDTIGYFALNQTEKQAGRFKLVGIKMENPGSEPPKDGSPVVTDKIMGYVCTARYSFSLNEPVGMALVDDSLAEKGTKISIFEDGCNGDLKHARIVNMPFYDHDGTRMRM